MAWRKYFAELIGAFILTLAVGTSLTVDLPIATPLIAGLTLGIFVYTIGSISGAHLNPAVTIGLFSVKKIDVRNAAMYIVAQVAGAALAYFCLTYFRSAELALVVEDTVQVGAAEALGAFVLVFAVSGVVFGKVDDDASGLTIGASLLLGILLTGGMSNGVLNPAVALGIGSMSLMYVIGPIAGGVAGAWVFKFLASEK